MTELFKRDGYINSKSQINKSIHDIFNKVRIEESKKLLKNTKNSILDVALAVVYEE
jgi:AraC-like DNA-binding protein